MDLDKLQSEFLSMYGTLPRIFRAPGRFNIIGEHTDYNEGFVLPAALELAVFVAARPRNDRVITARSLQYPGVFSMDLDQPEGIDDHAWMKYVRGVALIAEHKGHRLTGADLLIASDIPVGAGLSSSAALEIAVLKALSTLSSARMDGDLMARICQRAEHEFAGVRSGIMDQFAAVFGRRNRALFLDCRTLTYSLVELGDACFAIMNTHVRHSLADSEYNIRRKECEAAAERLGVSALRDVAFDDLSFALSELPETLAKRVRHIVTEDRRVIRTVNALREGDLTEVGKLLRESHESLRDDFEVSCHELDVLADIANAADGVYGARMMGGGFGGCVLFLIDRTRRESGLKAVAESYRKTVNIEPEVYDAAAGSGANEVGLRSPFIGSTN